MSARSLWPSCVDHLSVQIFSTKIQIIYVSSCFIHLPGHQILLYVYVFINNYILRMSKVSDISETKRREMLKTIIDSA